MIGGLSHIEDFRSRDVLTLPESRPDLVDIVAETGKSLGLRVSAIDREGGTVMLTASSSVVSEIVICKFNRADYAFQVMEGGRRLEIRITAWGNLGSGGQDEADRMMAEFKVALAKRLDTRFGTK